MCIRDSLVGDAKKARKVLDALIEANQGMWPELTDPKGRARTERVRIGG